MKQNLNNKLINAKLDKVMQNQQVILDFIKLVIYQQHPDAKKKIMIEPENLKEIIRKYYVW